MLGLKVNLKFLPGLAQIMEKSGQPSHLLEVAIFRQASGFLGNVMEMLLQPAPFPGLPGSMGIERSFHYSRIGLSCGRVKVGIL
jgi:hypothetical protein